ncbi:MAG: PAS domain-containing sensor histidine kinase [Chloroflexota bacterium]
MNQRACELFGYTHDELVVLSYRDLVVPDEHSQTANTLEKLLAGETFVPYERNFRKIDGTHFPAEINVQVVYNAYNDPIYIQSVLRDITERKRKEKQRLAIQLERERVRLLSTFIETAAHEFRTPLSIISTSNFILKKHTENERLHPHNEKIAHQVSRLSRLVDQLILMSKLESHREITRDVVNITNLLIMICQATQNDWQASRNLIMQIDDNLPTIQAHTAYTQEAVKHLLKNAYMATEHGGNIILRANNSDSHIVIDVEDDGMGIEQVNMGKMFTTFWRNDSAHTTPGFGIGLTIVKRIASLHDGDVTAISKAGEGSRFTLTIAHGT